MFNSSGYFTSTCFTLLGYFTIRMLNVVGYFTVSMLIYAGDFNINSFNCLDILPSKCLICLDPLPSNRLTLLDTLPVKITISSKDWRQPWTQTSYVSYKVHTKSCIEYKPARLQGTNSFHSWFTSFRTCTRQSFQTLNLSQQRFDGKVECIVTESIDLVHIAKGKTALIPTWFAKRHNIKAKRSSQQKTQHCSILKKKRPNCARPALPSDRSARWSFPS